MRRVEEDLARGHTFLAVQRLTTLVQFTPTDLDLRRRLADVHLRTGNLVEAGRWSYLDADRDPDAVVAFEKANRHPRARLDRLRWPASAPASGFAAQVMNDLATEARDAPTPGMVPVTRLSRAQDRLVGAGVGMFFLVNLLLWGAGVVALVRWVW